MIRERNSFAYYFEFTLLWSLKFDFFLLVPHDQEIPEQWGHVELNNDARPGEVIMETVTLEINFNFEL